MLDGLLEGARAGRSGVLVLCGEPGVGKTALLEYAGGSAPDLRVLRAVGVESEMELAFAGLHQLCAPILDRLDRLPEPQRDALATTFALSDGVAPDRFLVGLATLSLVTEVAAEHPVLCVIDDTQWLDRASLQALAFAARRLMADPVAMLFAAREPIDDLRHLPELRVTGLKDADARELLASVIAGRVDEQIADQLVAEARGNPLALLELPRGLSTAQLAGGFGLPKALSLQGRIEERFRERLSGLPEDARRLVTVAAAEPSGDPALLWRAAERLAITGRTPAPAVSGLIEIDSRVRFRHPLARSAVYGAATPELKRQVHRALAEATDPRLDPDRRAWHLAEAAPGPDEEVAAELERAAGRALARGGLAAAAAFRERAAMLTPDVGRRAQRALSAAQTKYEAGAIDDALRLIRVADVDGSDQLRHARVDLLRGQIAFTSDRGGDAPALLLKAARQLEAVDPALARATYLDALNAVRFAGPLARGTDQTEVSEAALAGPGPSQPPRPHDLLLEGLATLVTKGRTTATPILKEAVDAFQRETELPAQERRWLSLAHWAAADLWDDEACTLLAARRLERVRTTGELTAIPHVVGMVAYLHAISGELAAAESLADEIRAATEATGSPPYRYTGLWIAALRGREREVSELIEVTLSEAAARGEGFASYVTEHVTAALCNGLGRYDAAMAALRRQAVDPGYSDLSPRPMAELVEAAVRCGERQLAERALARVAESTQASRTDWALGVEARSRALLSDDDGAERLYREAIERLRRTRVRVQLARSHLLYGEWLRRERRRRTAREQLRIAVEMFTSMGTEAFAARAERELLLTGERARQRRVETSAQLTAQETQVARLARDGLSNAEIGARLFISQHTVAYHLRKVFAKLDITSRGQLRRALSPAAGQVA